MSGRELLIAGPTAVGKTEVALQLAERLDGEIISVDSMQVYRGLDIGTAKPTPAQRGRVPHHLIDILDPRETFDAAQFLRRASHAVLEIRERDRLPILCGGTGLYFKAWLEGIGQSPGPDAALRAELQQLPPEALLAELRERDPVTFAAIDRNNPRRVIRAVEVIRLTGKRFSEQRTRSPAPAVPFFVLQRDRTELHRRIDQRVDAMFAAGLVEETKLAINGPAARQALGYRQVMEHLEGKHTLEETIALVKLRTRQYAKRQLTWFRHQAQAQWVDGDDALAAMERVMLAHRP
ncbi:MAG TPA: tRNA (adenosine(37)-N6)-dimethylallyltransferase MiaA [Verrucomicrobiae bacterium]|nr:tRNA (adenosine(37)-N6)-dimethylallyltransferase MiaA [Verrucomicrobiae bacterium]